MTSRTLVPLLFLATWHLLIAPAPAATVTGTLNDISLQSLYAKLLFAPTNDVLVTAAGLSVGPPKTINTANGQFSITLDAGDYLVSLPLIPWRHPFPISVPNTNATINITNLLAAPHTYTYTNNLNYTVKATAADAGPGVLDAKIVVAGSLTKALVTNAGVVTLSLSNHPAGGGSAPLRVNTNPVIAWSTNGATSLVNTALSLSPGALVAGTVITIEAFGAFSDPGANAPIATFNLKLGSTTLIITAASITSAHWHLRGSVTIRSAGASGSIAAALAIIQDTTATEPFSSASQSATVDTTAALTLDLTAGIEDLSHAENVTADQLIIRLE